jgi:hypothetical protein
MNPRTRLQQTLSGDPCAPPRYESEFSDEVIQKWRAEGHLDTRSPEEFFGLDCRECIDIVWRAIPDEKGPLEKEAYLETLRAAYNPEDPARFPADWQARCEAWRDRDCGLFAEPWEEGLFQVFGIADGDSLKTALCALRERPALAEAAMDHYAFYLERMIERLLQDVQPDFVMLYEPIASNHAPVISPAEYARFAGPALRRICARLETLGVRHRIVWTAGAVTPLIPVWLDAGVNGLYVNQAGQAKVSYPALRREYGLELCLLGGIDWRAVVEGPSPTDHVLESVVQPLLEKGGYIPYLDDTIRDYMPFEHFLYYRQCLDALR